MRASIDYDGDPDAGAKLDAFIRWAQSIVVRYGGSLLQFTTGDKGSSFYCSFGAPIANDNDPARAAQAALLLRAPPSPSNRPWRWTGVLRDHPLSRLTAPAFYAILRPCFC